MRSCIISLVRQILLELSVQEDEVNAEHDRQWGNDGMFRTASGTPMSVPRYVCFRVT